MPKKYYGVIPPIVTPIDENERVVERELRAMVEHCIEIGMHAIFVAGSNGECMSLTQQERDRAIGIALDQCAGRIPVLAGVMDTSTLRVVENIKRFEQMGGSAAVVTPEFYARHTCPGETVRHFEEISRRTSADLVIYNIPLYTGCTLRAETIFEIARIDQVVAYKDSAGLVPDTIRCINHFRGSEFSVLQGITGLAATSMLLGADGFVPSIGPIFPKACLKVYEYGRARNIDKAMEWDEILVRAQSICAVGTNANTATKRATAVLGLTGAEITLPHQPLTPCEEEEIVRRTQEMIAFLETKE